MPRGSGAGNSNSSGNHPSFRGTEQSLNIMRQVKSYFNVGMDHVLEVAADMAEYGIGKGEDSQVKKLREMMQSYILMEQSIDIFMTAAEDVMTQGEDYEEMGGLEEMLRAQIKEQSKGNSENSIKKHEKYTELEQRIWDCQNPGTGEVPRSFGASAPLTEDGIEMTQEEVNTKCPYTGKEMVEPVRNIICKHSYDKIGIKLYIEQRRRKALCPVSGCSNKKPIVLEDLEDHKEMKRYIMNKKKRLQPSTSASVGAALSRNPESASQCEVVSSDVSNW